PLQGHAVIQREELLERPAVIARGSRAQPPLVRELIEKLLEQPEAGVASHSRPPRLEKSQQGRACELTHALQVQRAHLRIETQNVLAAQRKHPEALFVAQGYVRHRANVRGPLAEPGCGLGVPARATE